VIESRSFIPVGHVIENKESCENTLNGPKSSTRSITAEFISTTRHKHGNWCNTLI